jgi:hypothetical protein
MGTLIRLSERSANRSGASPGTDQIKAAAPMRAGAIREQFVAIAVTSDALNQIIDAIQENIRILDGLTVTIENAEKREELRRKLSLLGASLLQSSAGLEASAGILRKLKTRPIP